MLWKKNKKKPIDLDTVVEFLRTLNETQWEALEAMVEAKQEYEVQKEALVSQGTELGGYEFEQL